ncbi:MAG: serine--tRNA ligase [Candidatus Omnitrophota bacterium]|nr:serine--tRNA ligase [Candidatus Omnitrophota bacterium]
MLDIKFIKENEQIVNKSLKDRGIKIGIDILLDLYEKRKTLLIKAEDLKYKKNLASAEIANLVREKKDSRAKIDSMKVISQKIKGIDKKVGELGQKIREISLTIPNIPHPSVPVGSEPAANKIVRQHKDLPKLKFEPRTHLEIGEALGIMDFGRASKLVGSHFSLFKGQGAKLERALINFMLDLHTRKHNYVEIWPPSLVNRSSMTGTGQLPKLEEDMYRLKDEDYFLVPTAEVPLTNIHQNEILKEDDLPIYYTAYTPCFRREAGSYGKETKGLVRVHQFDKVELVKFVRPESSSDELESLLKDAQKVLELLELPYRVVLLPTRGISFAAAKCYDLEVWAPGIKRWLEVSSCSMFNDFQARRANIKYKPKTGAKPQYVHTLNGSGVALARTVAALLENFQQRDGNVKLPKALVPYMDGRNKIE